MRSGIEARLHRFVRALLSRLGRISVWRRKRRQAILSIPFPRPWADFMETRSEHYRHLPIGCREQFKDQTRIFLAEKRITGVEMEVTDEARLLVAASAVTLTAGWPGYTWDQLAEVLLYPDDFDQDYKFGGTDASGIAHQWGVVILSVPALQRSFDGTAGSYHVGFHEFAHLLDLAQTRFDGIPSYLSDDSIRQWSQILEREEERLRHGDSVLDPYALASSVELFAVAVEAFFQTPVTLADRHPELYAFLSSYFCQDPAAWNKAATL